MKVKVIPQKVVVITGGTSGIGAEIVKLYKDMGHIVCALSKDVLDDIPKNNAVKYFTCDVTNEIQVKNCIELIGAKYKKIDVVINCAGYGLAGALELTPTLDAKKQFDTNFFGGYLINKYAIKFMPKNSTIVHIASACALFALPFRGMYCASKSAIDMYSKCLSMELASSKINVISICPGDVKTNFSKNRVKVYETNERYGTNIEKSLKKVEANQEKRMEPVFVAKKIVKFASKKHPRSMYIIGAKYKFLYFLSKIVPQKIMLKFTNRMFGK
jgi:NAD(P)-dependent dehydrogenase (short-subunit alcohol dehydrogenase family)